MFNLGGFFEFQIIEVLIDHSFLLSRKTLSMAQPHQESLIKRVYMKYPNLRKIDLSNNCKCWCLLLSTILHLIIIFHIVFNCCTALQSLYDIESYASTMVQINLNYNQIQDVRPLSVLIHLTHISLEQNNMYVDNEAILNLFCITIID